MPSTTITATYSPEDNKLRLYASSRLDSETYERVKAAGFKWAPKQVLFVAPMWTPSREDLCVELAGEVGDEDTSLVERAEAKAERLEDLSERRADEAERARKAVDAIADGIPFGQPILIGHHSERRARKDAEKIENGMRKAVNCWKASGYWQDRAKGCIRNAKYKELPAVRARRIKGIESDLRKMIKEQTEAQKWLNAWTKCEAIEDAEKQLSTARMIANYCRLYLPKKDGDKGDHCTAYDALRVHEAGEGDYRYYAERTIGEVFERARKWYPHVIADRQRWIDHYNNRLAYERAMLDDSGGLVAEQQEIVVGGRILSGGEWNTVIRVTRKDGRILSVRTAKKGWGSLVSAENIKGYEPPTAEEAAQVAAAVKMPPLCNYPREDFATCTQAEWDAIDKDHKGVKHIIEETDTTGRHRVRKAIGYKLHLPAPTGRELEPGFCNANRTHSYWPVFITDAKRTDPPKKAPKLVEDQEAAPALFATRLDLPTLERRAAAARRATIASIDQLAEDLFERTENGKIRAGFKWTHRDDGPEPHECYQYDSLDEVMETAAAYESMDAITSFSIVTHTGQYENMRTIYKCDKRAAAFEALEKHVKAGTAVQVVTAPQLFPTPLDLAARVVKEAGIEAGHRVLDPEVGTGNLARAAFDVAPIELVAVEVNGRVLEAFRQSFASWGNSRIETVHGDFLEQNGNLGKFDRIIMNPPFENGADIKHIEHARHFLKPRGRLVAVCANGPRQRERLMPLAENSGGWWEDLPDGRFKEQGTGVNTALLVIEG